MENNVRFTHRGDKRRVIAYIADAEIQDITPILIDHIVGRRDAIEVFEPHVVLLRLVARKDRDLSGFAHFTREYPFDQSLPERSRTARDEYSFAF